MKNKIYALAFMALAVTAASGGGEPLPEVTAENCNNSKLINGIKSESDRSAFQDSCRPIIMEQLYAVPNKPIKSPPMKLK